MKKQWTTCLLIATLLLAMTGCSAVNAAEERIEAKLDIVEDKLEERIRDAVTPLPETTQKAAVGAGMLTEDQARKIALDYLGFTEDQVTRLHIEFEMDDGVPQYDVAFYQGDWEYEFEIHGETGRILSYDKDHRNN